jgi:hypothetical protein
MVMPVKGLDKAVANIERQVYEVAHRRAMARVREVVDFARNRWPVGQRDRTARDYRGEYTIRRLRPHSRDLFRIEDRSDGVDRVHIVIQNDAKDKRGTPYAFFIRSAQVASAGKKNAWLVLVRRPTLAALADLAEQTVRDPLGRE